VRGTKTGGWSRRRRAVQHVCEKLGASERRACRVLGQPRSTQRYRASPPSDEPKLVSRMIDLARVYGRYGYRRITALLRREGLRVPKKQQKRGRLWMTDGSCLRLRPEYRNQVWSYDFVADRTANGHPLKILTIIDEFTRECLAIDVARSIRSIDVLQTLAKLFLDRGAPEYLRSDNGPEMTSALIREWLGELEVQTLFIEPGSPWENGYVGSFNGRLQDEFLNGAIFYTLKEAKILIEQWRREYNGFRPHSSQGYRPPAPETIMPMTPRSRSFEPAKTALALT